ncbi:histidine kinase [Leptothermofonsia sichuanensis E412]|uniref:histidine kinase n=1 Tax=Leptothermofonsia sichuanensis TaxID=2917832 RepID=UPI001CA6A8AF|nr:histidine kinase [Leptothermofonsia sichuanensis]QZZ19967.1 histidine kinase [Leptothermofonsia sichuanensis E412]
MPAFPEKSADAEMPLQLLLFVDKRPSSREQIRHVRETLKDLRATYPFELQIVDVGEQPYLAEHFKLIATPTLIKIHPEPRQTLAGSNLVEQLQHWWTYWQRSVEDYLEDLGYSRDRLDQIEEDKTTPTSEKLSLIARSDSLPPASARTTDLTEATPSHQALSSSGVSGTAGASGTSTIHKVISSIARSAELIQLSDEIFRLKREKEELEHQLQFKDQILGMLAHDLRNPLTATSIALETLEMGHDPEEGWSSRMTPALTAQLLKHARTQTRAIDRMITDILQAARGASAELRIQPQRLDIGSLCLEVIKDLQGRFNAKSQKVEQDIPSDLPPVLADGERVRQVIVNLLDNAIKYTPVQGTISLSILHRTTQKVQISVCDNGPGIPEENRERIFEDHFRLERDEQKEGYGIGLSLCQRIIRAHYGQIWVESTPNQGSCFHFTLPVFRSWGG